MRTDPVAALALSATVKRRPGSVRGSALLVSLVLLLVVTVAGIAGMAGAILQERMAGNLQDGMQVFEATEATLRRCEDRVRNGNSSATGTAPAKVIDEFNQGTSSINTTYAEYFIPDDLGDGLSAQGGTNYQIACLIQFNGFVDALQAGGSMRRPLPSGSLVTYIVTASGARVPESGNTIERPSVILETRIVMRR